MQYLGHTYIKLSFVAYLKFKFNWASCILSGNPTQKSVYSSFENIPKNYNAVTLDSHLASTVITLSQTSSLISYNGPLIGNEYPDDPEYECLIFKIIIKCKHKIFKFSFWESETMASHSPKGILVTWCIIRVLQRNRALARECLWRSASSKSAG